MKKLLAGLALSALLLPTAFAADPTGMRIAGNFSSNSKHVDDIERPFFTALPKLMGYPININYNPMDVVNVQAADALRLLRSGTFDVMSVQIGIRLARRPVLRGHRPDRRVHQHEGPAQGRGGVPQGLRRAPAEARFKAKVMTLWPFGPQVFYCNKPIKSIDDVKGLKIRSFTPSMAELIKTLGATPVTLQFSEVYPASATRRGRLRRDLADLGQFRQVARGDEAISCRCRCRARCRAI